MTFYEEIHNVGHTLVTQPTTEVVKTIEQTVARSYVNKAITVKVLKVQAPELVEFLFNGISLADGVRQQMGTIAKPKK